MRAYEGKPKLEWKKFIIGILERFIPKQRVQSHLFFWARIVVRIRRPFIIGVTGSVGKSTTTEMVAAVLMHREAQSIVGPVGQTLGNMNDDVGLPATLLRFDNFYNIPYAYPSRLALLCLLPLRALRIVIGRYPKVLVLEFGAGWSGHLNRLVSLAPPNVAVVTTIGAAHLERLKTLEGVTQEKSVLVAAVPSTGLVILGQDHDYVAQLEQASRAPVIKVTGRGVELSHNITQAVCRHLGIPDEVVSSALRNFKSPKGRLNRLELIGMTVIDDSYNANPLSMKLGLDTLAQIARPGHRRLAVLGAMAELGDEGRRYHEEIGAYARTRADMLVGVGELSKHYSPDIWFDDSDACANQIEDIVRANDCLLVKGSFSIRMERIVSKLREVANRPESTLLP